MPLYQFKAIDAKGKVITNSCNATSVETLTDILKNQGLFLMEAKEFKAIPSIAAPAGTAGMAAPRGNSKVTPVPMRPPHASDSVALDIVAIFTSEWAIMVRTNTPIEESLRCLAQQQPNKKFKAILLDIHRMVQQGEVLSQAFSKYPKVFDNIYTNLLNAGLATGKLNLMLERIASYLNFHRDLKAKMRSALIYPLIVVGSSVGAVVFIVLFVLPTFSNIFSQFDAKLPIPTRILLGISTHVRGWWFVYGGIIASAGAYLYRWLHNPVNTEFIDTFKLKLPALGLLVRNLAITRVLRTLATLLKSDVQILKALDIARDTVGNKVFYKILGQVHHNTSEGKGLALALTGNPFFPEQAANMIANAEKMGTLPQALDELAEYYEKETDKALKNLFSAMEPLFVIFLGVMVGGIAAAMLLPIFNLGGQIRE